MDPRPLVFLSLNDRLDEDECRRQVRRLAANGWGGFYMHVRQGMAEAFLGPRFLRAIRSLVEEAKLCGLKAWIYDEDRWPSGSGGGLAGMDPRLRQRVLCKRAAGWVPAQHETVVLATADATYVEHVQAFDIHRAPGGCVGDLLNPETTARLISEAYEPYTAVVGDEFGKTVPGFFMDEPNVIYHFSFPLPAVPWTVGMEDLYRARWGEELRPLLPALFGQAAGAERARYRFRRLVEERLAEAFFKPLHDWCGKHGLEFVGHLNAEESLSSIVRWAGISAAALPWFHVPGVDMLGRKLDEHPTLKTAVGAARQLGRVTQSELFGLAGPGATPEDLRWIADWHLACGVTRFCSHLAHFSLRGQRKHDCLPSIHSHQPYAPAIPALTARLDGLARLLDEGQPGCDVAVLQPMDAAWLTTLPVAAFSDLFDHHTASIRPVQESYLATLEGVLHQPRDADVLAEPLLDGPGAVSVRSEAGTLVVGAMRYRAVVLPLLGTIRPATLRVLVAAGEAGVALVATAALPTLVDGSAPDQEQAALLAKLAKLVSVCTESTVAAELDRRAPARLAVRSADHGGWLRVHERVLSSGVRRMFLHHGDRRQGCTIALDVDQPWCVVDAVSGARQALTGSTLTLPPGGSALLEIGVHARGRAPEALRLASPLPARNAAHETAWDVRRSAANLLPLHRCQWRGATGTWSHDTFTHHLHEALVAARHHGRLQVRYTCASELVSHQGLRLMVEEAPAWEITINGVAVAWDGGAPWIDPAFLTVAVGHLFRTGENVIELSREYVEPRIFSPAYQPRVVGVEVCPVMLMGEFSLTTAAITPCTPHRDWDLTGLPMPEVYEAIVPRVLQPVRPLALADITRSGAPHYSGEVVCRAELDWAGGPARLVCDDIDGGVARLAVDGVDRGLLPWGPWIWDLGALGAGRHVVELVVANTLRNSLSFMNREQGDEHFVHLATHAYARRLATLGRPADLGPMPADRVRLNPCGVRGVRLVGG
jgi:hypothetical protein